MIPAPPAAPTAGAGPHTHQEPGRMNARLTATVRSHLVTLTIASLGLLIAVTATASQLHANQSQGEARPTRELRPVAFAQDEPGAQPDIQPDTHADAQPAAPGQPAMTAPKYAPRVVDPSDGGLDPLGDLDDAKQKTYLTFTPLGAGIDAIKLPDEFETVRFVEHVTLQQQTVSDSGVAAVPFAAISVVIEGVSVPLSGSHDAPVWAQKRPGVFEAFVDSDTGEPVLRIERAFALKPGSAHGFTLTETVENLTGQPLRVSLNTTGLIDMPQAKTTYAGDRRRVRYGFIAPPEQQGTSLRVQVDNELRARTKLLGKRASTAYGKAYEQSLTVWPNEQILPGAARLSWLGLTDRYFAVLMHPVFDPASVTDAEQKLLTGYARIDRLVLDPYAPSMDTVQLMRLVGEQHELAPGASTTHTLGVYAGMRNKPILTGEPVPAALNMPDMVVSNLGGFCAPCTFQWLAHILMGVLLMFHSMVGDWAVSIILLVFVVRACLHPITRWSQIRVQRFSVQMQSMAPKQKALREKYKDDSKRQQQEMAKLWREEGISPAGMLGCLPMFMQTPVWIALYATLYFATELRHEAAFYGVFQHMGGWGFMSDLAAADGAIPLPSAMHFSFPLWGSVTSINVLPILMGVLMWAHQKYLTPPTQASLSPEQESQQKMMKVMMVFMFPVMMYAAPSGLALYFITNSAVGILENKWIRAHMKKHGMLEIENIRAQRKDKGPGFMQRLMEAAEAQKQLREKGPAQPNPASRQHRRPK